MRLQHKVSCPYLSLYRSSDDRISKRGLQIDEQEKTISQLKEKLKLFENTSKYKSSHSMI